LKNIFKTFLGSNNPKNIYTVTTIANLTPHYRKDGTSYEYRDCRCVGFYFDSNEASRIIINNCGDIYEAGEYPYAVIEGVVEGLYGSGMHDVDNRWFEYSQEKENYVEIKKCPTDLERTCGFGIG
jgi:hypothetical protein